MHIEKKRAKEFERLFEGDELKRWDDYTARGRFVEARLIRCRYSALQRQLGLKRYETAWMMLHKLRRAMVAPQRSPLIGVIEVDDAYIGGTDSVRRGGRDSFGAATIVIIAVEVRGNGSGRIRMKAVVTKPCSSSLLSKNTVKLGPCEMGSTSPGGSLSTQHTTLPGRTKAFRPLSARPSYRDSLCALDCEPFTAAG